MVAIPGALTYVAYKTEVRLDEPSLAEPSADWIICKDSAHNLQGKYELRGKRKGDTISEW